MQDLATYRTTPPTCDRLHLAALIRPAKPGPTFSIQDLAIYRPARSSWSACPVGGVVFPNFSARLCTQLLAAEAVGFTDQATWRW
ncbi:hypothetical protein V6N11_077301 [Hibiscus sabdariffa]|uniref:Uncharacterized protein n=1 Tax=Hibiscus sabdariffa TaxID=183260 RepID=A0ABR2TDC9_9ROSI